MSGNMLLPSSFPSFSFLFVFFLWIVRFSVDDEEFLFVFVFVLVLVASRLRASRGVICVSDAGLWSLLRFRRAEKFNGADDDGILV